MKPPTPRVVVADSRRETLIAVLAGIVITGLGVYGIVLLSRPYESPNILTGVVVGKHFTPGREEQVSFSGRRIEGVKQIDGEHLLQVRVEKEKRTYDVPVEKPVYESKETGDTLEFVLPPSEQR